MTSLDVNPIKAGVHGAKKVFAAKKEVAGAKRADRPHSFIELGTAGPSAGAAGSDSVEMQTNRILGEADSYRFALGVLADAQDLSLELKSFFDSFNARNAGKKLTTAVKLKLRKDVDALINRWLTKHSLSADQSVTNLNFLSRWIYAVFNTQLSFSYDPLNGSPVIDHFSIPARAGERKGPIHMVSMFLSVLFSSDTKVKDVQLAKQITDGFAPAIAKANVDLQRLMPGLPQLDADLSAYRASYNRIVLAIHERPKVADVTYAQAQEKLHFNASKLKEADFEAAFNGKPAYTKTIFSVLFQTFCEGPFAANEYQGEDAFTALVNLAAYKARSMEKSGGNVDMTLLQPAGIEQLKTSGLILRNWLDIENTLTVQLKTINPFLLQVSNPASTEIFSSVAELRRYTEWPFLADSLKSVATSKKLADALTIILADPAKRAELVAGIKQLINTGAPDPLTLLFAANWDKPLPSPVVPTWSAPLTAGATAVPAEEKFVLTGLNDSKITMPGSLSIDASLGAPAASWLTGPTEYDAKEARFPDPSAAYLRPQAQIKLNADYFLDFPLDGQNSRGGFALPQNLSLGGSDGLDHVTYVGGAGGRFIGRLNTTYEFPVDIDVAAVVNRTRFPSFTVPNISGGRVNVKPGFTFKSSAVDVGFTLPIALEFGKASYVDGANGDYRRYEVGFSLFANMNHMQFKLDGNYSNTSVLFQRTSSVTTSNGATMRDDNSANADAGGQLRLLFSAALLADNIPLKLGAGMVYRHADLSDSKAYPIGFFQVGSLAHTGWQVRAAFENDPQALWSVQNGLSKFSVTGEFMVPVDSGVWLGLGVDTGLYAEPYESGVKGAYVMPTLTFHVR